jgi:hypothetical protein
VGLVVAPQQLLKASCRLIVPLLGILFAMTWWATSQRTPYAVLDDYRMISATKAMRPFLIEGHAETEMVTGRIIPAFLFDLVWIGVRSIDDLWYVRLIGIAVVAATVLLYQMWLIRYADITSLLARTSVGCTTFIVLLLPCVSATTTWAQKATQLFALPLAMLAGVLTTAPKLRLQTWGGVVALIFMSVFSYQHFVAVAMLPLAIAVGITKSRFEKPPIFRIWILLAIMVSALVTNVVFVRLVASDVLERVYGRSLSNRVAETWDVLGKGGNLFIDQDALLISISASLILAIVTMSLAMNKRLIFVCIAISLAVGCSIAITLGGDGDSSYRMTFPTQFSLWLGLGSLISVTLQQRRDGGALNWARVLGVAILVAASMVTMVESRKVLGAKISFANAEDWTSLNCHIRSLEPNTSIDDVVVRLAPTTISGPQRVASEIGLLARHVEWIFRDQWELAINSNLRFGAVDQLNLVVVDYDQRLPPESDRVTTIDLQTICLENPQ